MRSRKCKFRDASQSTFATGDKNKKKDEIRKKGNIIGAVDNEVEDFLQYCQANNISFFDIQKNLLKSFASTLKDVYENNKAFIYILVILVFLFCLFALEFLSSFFIAIGRLLMVNILEFYDWRPLINKRCLVPTPFSPKFEYKSQDIDCIFCQGNKDIDVKDDIVQKDLHELYILSNKPIIIAKAIESWGEKLANATELNHFLRTDPKVSNSFPCRITSDHYFKRSDVKNLMNRSEKLENFLLHFQICERNAIKHLRMKLPRPNFFSFHLSPVHRSWIFISKNFNMFVHKHFQFEGSVFIFVQLLGKSYIRLEPINDCENVCPLIDIELIAGEALIITDYWIFGYKSNPDTYNVAFALETAK